MLNISTKLCSCGLVLRQKNNRCNILITWNFSWSYRNFQQFLNITYIYRSSFWAKSSRSKEKKLGYDRKPESHYYTFLTWPNFCFAYKSGGEENISAMDIFYKFIEETQYINVVRIFLHHALPRHNHTCKVMLALLAILWKSKGELKWSVIQQSAK